MNVISTTVKDVTNRTCATVIFGKALASNLEEGLVCPVMAALCTAMGKVDLPYDDWVRIIQLVLPELSGGNKLFEYIYGEDFTFLNIRPGESQLFDFLTEITRRL